MYAVIETGGKQYKVKEGDGTAVDFVGGCHGELKLAAEPVADSVEGDYGRGEVWVFTPWRSAIDAVSWWIIWIRLRRDAVVERMRRRIGVVADVGVREGWGKRRRRRRRRVVTDRCDWELF